MSFWNKVKRIDVQVQLLRTDAATQIAGIVKHTPVKTVNEILQVSNAITLDTCPPFREYIAQGLYLEFDGKALTISTKDKDHACQCIQCQNEKR